MRNIKTFKALFLSALVSAAALGTDASATQVYFVNGSGTSSVVDVYVDGQLVFDNIFAHSGMMFSRDIAAGEHEIVVTPFSLAPGERDVLTTTVTVPGSGEYTLALADGENVPTLALSSGHTE